MPKMTYRAINDEGETYDERVSESGRSDVLSLAAHNAIGAFMQAGLVASLSVSLVDGGRVEIEFSA